MEVLMIIKHINIDTKSIKKQTQTKIVWVLMHFKIYYNTNCLLNKIKRQDNKEEINT